jgi:hypothetical protein
LAFAATDLLGSLFRPTSAVEALIGPVRARLRHPVVCLHIRTGVVDEHGVPFLSPGDEDAFIRRAHEVVPRARSMFLATDDTALSARLRERLGAVTLDAGPIVHTGPVGSPPGIVDPKGAIRAFGDWILLSECDAIVGTAWSTFGRSAALRGRVARFEVVDDSRCGQPGHRRCSTSP